MNDIKAIDSVSKQIIEQINPEWSKLQKIRFVYLKLGDFLEKNTDFYLNDKLDTLKMGYSDISKIYYDDVMTETKRSGTLKYQVICKSAAKFLKAVYDKVGIESYLIHAHGNDDELLHWFLLAQDETNQYFLTLASDLPYIKNNFPTYHFASHINYLSKVTGVEQYDIPQNSDSLKLVDVMTKNSNGDLINIREIEHTVLAPTSLDSLSEFKLKMKKMMELDESIGYKKLYDESKFATSLNFYKLFYEYTEANSEVFDIFNSCFNIGTDYLSKIDDITEKQIIDFKKRLNVFICKRLDKKFNISNNNEDPSNYDEYFNIYIKKILNNCDPVNTTELLSKYKDDLKKSEYYEEVNLIKTIINVEKRFDNLIFYRNKCDLCEKKINQLVKQSHNINDIKEIENIQNNIIDLSNDLLLLEETFNESKIQLSIPKLNPVLNRISLYFLKDTMIDENTDTFLPMNYITNKLELLFPLIFDCDFQYSKNNHKTDFSVQGYSEQVTIIKHMLKNLFSELSIKNCHQLPNYDDQMSAIDNRIRIFPLKDSINSEYSVGFRIWANTDLDEDEVEYVYVSSENLLRKRNPLSDKKYIYVSNSIKNKVEEMENIEESNLKK